MILYPNPDSYFKDGIFYPFCKSLECQKSLDEIKFESFPLFSKSWLLSTQLRMIKMLLLLVCISPLDQQYLLFHPPQLHKCCQRHVILLLLVTMLVTHNSDHAEIGIVRIARMQRILILTLSLSSQNCLD